ncbi:MAG: hypothetical protein JW871_00075 [Endomicrobiales bacterium]|nr:hypothetical protein [Endomicrobiales bacterium]
MKKLIVLSIIICFSLNGIVPQLIIHPDTYDDVTYALKKHSKVFEPFALITMSVKLVTNVFVEHNPLLGAISNPLNTAQDKDNKSRRDSSSNATLLTKLPTLRRGTNANNNAPDNKCYSIRGLSNHQVRKQLDVFNCIFDFNYIFLILLYTLILLPRGTINDNNIINLGRYSPIPT